MQSILKTEKYDNGKFYNANAEYLRDNGNKSAWKTMWLEVLGACTSTIKKFCRKVPGIYREEDIVEFALEGAERVMRSITKHQRKVENLSNYVYMYCYGVFYSIKRQNVDKMECPLNYEGLDISYNSFEDDIIEKLSSEGY